MGERSTSFPTADSLFQNYGYLSYLLRIHGRCAKGVDDNHVGSRVGVDEVGSIALPQAVHHT